MQVVKMLYVLVLKGIIVKSIKMIFVVMKNKITF